MLPQKVSLFSNKPLQQFIIRLNLAKIITFTRVIF